MGLKCGIISTKRKKRVIVRQMNGVRGYKDKGNGNKEWRIKERGYKNKTSEVRWNGQCIQVKPRDADRTC